MLNTASNVAVLVGSLRGGSYNRKVVRALIELAPRSLRLEIVDIARLPVYDEQRDTRRVPPDWRLFRQQIRAADGLLLLAPECRRVVPAVLRNALEIASRPPGDNAWEGKPCGVISISPTGAGNAGADHRLRQTLAFLNIPLMQPPYACSRGTGRLLDASGRPDSPGARLFLQNFIGAFDSWVRVTARH